MAGRSVGILNANQLKMIAAVTMFIDHLGYFLFPGVAWLRIIGRISYPIFAFFIAEGCIHTKSMKRYFGRICGIGLVCMLGTYLFSGQIYGNIMITFSFSVLIIGVIERVMVFVFDRNRIDLKTILMILLVPMIFSLVFIFCQVVSVDYGFAGTLVPVGCWFFQKRGQGYGILALATGLAVLSILMGVSQVYCLIAIFLLLLYNKERGKLPMKKFFYLFYPVHVVLLQVVAFFLQME